MQVSDFNFPFDPALIASEPVFPRDHARLLVVHPPSSSFDHRSVAELPELLTPGDLIVVNDTKVRPARIVGYKSPSGVPVDLLFVKELSERTWSVLVKGTFRPGQRIDLAPSTWAVVQSGEAGQTVVRIEGTLSVRELFDRHGRMPLPPYIKRASSEKDREWYQTVFAGEEGAIAAPTAGLHFTSRLLARLAERGIGMATVTLHVGLGTFKPVTVDRVEAHRMESEWMEIDEDAVQAVERTRADGGKIIAVGTTVVRSLESVAREDGKLKPYRGETRLFITPGFPFRVVDALVTNFHLPKSTLLMLVAAFGGLERIRRAYDEAVRARYRFYSYGDAMLIAARESCLVNRG